MLLNLSLSPTKDIDLGIINPIAFASTSMDELYYHQAMKAPDAKQFVRACMEEVKAHHEPLGPAIRDRKSVV